jgi:DNA-binding transcriptional ArsR family regulator
MAMTLIRWLLVFGIMGSIDGSRWACQLRLRAPAGASSGSGVRIGDVQSNSSPALQVEEAIIQDYSTIRLTISVGRLILNHMVERSDLALDGVFRALADPTRRAMLHKLAAGESNIGELAAPFRMSFAAASKHVKVLEGAGLVRRRVQGRRHVCRIEPAPLAAADEWLRFYHRLWTEQLDRLDGLLQAEDQPESESHQRKRAKR